PVSAATARQWQDASLLDLTTETVVAFLAIITSIPAGRRFTVNDLRSRLDAADVPARQRGGLFNRALAAGLIEAVKVSAWGVDYDVRVASTSEKTHRATVRVYRRTGPES
ncbi:MAG TPA: hypothetical protein VMV41_16060, partial [Cellulomonadaceae bacterium]|nr:hypothetical protein [Cellulomonadaceae bacterium]